MPKTQRDIVIAAPISDVFAVITDYERYPEFLPEIRAVQVLRRDDGVALVEFELDLIIRSTYTLRLQEDAPDRVSWLLHGSKHLKKNTGFWQLSADGDGGTRARYGVEVELLGQIPRPVSERLVGPTLDSILERFRVRAQAPVAVERIG